jgi:hypothetical protein
MVDPSNSEEMMSPYNSEEMVSPFNSEEMVSPYHSEEMMDPFNSEEMVDSSEESGKTTFDMESADPSNYIYGTERESNIRTRRAAEESQRLGS